MKKGLVFIVLSSILSINVFASNVLDLPSGESTSVGIYIKSLVDGKVIVDENSALALTPASVTKAFTTASALHLLGPDYNFTTRVELVGNKVAVGEWNGNLVIKGGGDPTLESPDFKARPGFADSIVASLRRLGVKSITGNIVIEENMPEAGPVPQWEVEDIAWPYGAGIYGFNYGGNFVRVSPNKGTTTPPSNLNIEVRNSPDGHNDILRGVGSLNLIVWASRESRQNARWSLGASIPDPAEVFKMILQKKLTASGITIGTRSQKVANAETITVYTHTSAPMSDICRDLMKRSDNLFAEGVLRAFVPGEIREKCLKKELDLWSSKGLDTKPTLINDGSGLTRANRIPPLFLGELLEKMTKTEFADLYVSFFPLAGVDGTLKKFLENSPLKGRLALKTGSVRSVQTYAGYKLDAEGKPTHVVVIMVNGFFCPRPILRKHIESYLLKVFEN